MSENLLDCTQSEVDIIYLGKKRHMYLVLLFNIALKSSKRFMNE